MPIGYNITDILKPPDIGEIHVRGFYCKDLNNKKLRRKEYFLKSGPKNFYFRAVFQVWPYISNAENLKNIIELIKKIR